MTAIAHRQRQPRTTMTDSPLPPFPRLMSNKENPAPYPTLSQTLASARTPSAEPKPRLGGVGRAPRPRARKHSLNKPYSRKGSFTHKSRYRQTSVQRAKLAITARKRSLGKKKVDPNDKGFKIAADVHMNDAPRPTYRLTPVGTVTVPAQRMLEDFLPASMPHLVPAEIEGAIVPADEVESDDDAETVAKPKPAAKPAATFPTKMQFLGRLPFTMPVILKRPMIPPVLHDTDGDCPVPIDYVLQRIKPFFATIHRLLPLFEEASITLRTPPQRIHTPTFATTDGPMQRIDDMFDTLPFWVEQAIPYAGLNENMKKLAYHWGPDACLVIRKKGVLGTAGEFYPIKKLVLTAQCGFFEDVATKGHLLRGESIVNPDKDKPCIARQVADHVRARLPRPVPKPRTSAARTTLTRAPQSIRVSGSRWTCLAPSAEAIPEIVVDLAEPRAAPAPAPEQAAAPTRALPAAPKTQPKPAHPIFYLAEPVETYPPPKPPHAGHRSYGTRQCDLIPMYLPDPVSFPALLTALHYPGHSPVRHLIPTPPQGTAASTEEIVEYLRCLSPSKLDNILDRIFGFYSNVCELGINNENFWAAINNAWSMAYTAKQRRTHVYPPLVEDYNFEMGPVVRWKLVMGLPRPGEKVPESKPWPL